MSGDAHVLIEQLRVDQRRVEDRVAVLERLVHASGGAPAAAAPPAPASRQRVVPSVRVLPQRPPVPPVPPIQPARPGAPRIHHGAPSGVVLPPAAPPAVAAGAGALDAVLGAVGRLLTSPDAAARFDRLADSLMGVVQTHLGDIAGELLHATEHDAPAPAPASSDVPPVPPIVPAAPAPASDAVDLGFAPSSVVEYTQTEATR